jgi:hypothetical protein
MQLMKRWRLILLERVPAVVSALVIVGLALTPSAMAEAFCETEIVHNYSKPLEGLPKQQDIPASQKLPFGPAGVFLGRGHQSCLMLPGHEEVGYALSFQSRPPVRLASHA